jgi:hypothetical protein
MLVPVVVSWPMQATSSELFAGVNDAVVTAVPALLETRAGVLASTTGIGPPDQSSAVAGYT